MKVHVSRRKLESYAYILVQENRITHVDNRFLKLSGYGKDDIMGQDISQVCSELLRLTYDIRLLKRGQETACFLFTKDLYPRKVTVMLRQENDVKIIGFKEDINWSIEDKFPFIDRLCDHNTLGTGIFAITPNIVLLKANETFLSFFDEPFNKRENAIGRQIQEFVTGWKGSGAEKIWEKILEKGEYFHINEYEYDRLERGTTYWKTILMPIHGKNGVQYVAEVTEEITQVVLDRKRIEEQNVMISQQKEQLEMALQMKDEFFSMISHEFKTPLNVIYSAVQAMELICGDELSDKGKGFINKIRQNTFRQLRLVNNILDITRMNARQFSMHIKNLDIVFLTKAIAESVELYAKQKDIQINFTSEVEQAVIGIDDEKYERILLNLMSNAIKFTPRNGRINVNLADNEDTIRIEIEDTGIGIPKEKQKEIFERFGQVDSSLSRQAEGTGIGLSLVKRFVEAMGGNISLTSEVGTGSTFTILLPKNQAEEVDTFNSPLGLTNDRLINTIRIEFSDIYLT
ncbi:signal transduction histidine kinase [Anaerosolibacter carboniphilus]|uniref:histidine kinase n=1 Tax=Anaerosolibacter carboniphilus TaxID=1417629 RepID=A0A841KU21_9FIRM|nr:HAMP domain-containing sensor histidine kinase [Anaerosolibacter carboniphilus]MBB6214432.1 signal transduction histidine kinase [Anaerosolibacter carboniphilus]